MTAVDTPALELALPPDQLPRLARLPGMRPGRAAALKCTWHDTPARDLAAAGLSLSHERGLWRLHRLALPSPGQPPTLVAEASTPEALNHPLPSGLTPLPTPPTRLRLIQHGETTLHVTAHPGAARIRLEGPAPATAALAAAIATALPVTVPRLSLAAEHAPPPPPLTAELSHGQPIDDALAAIVASLHDALLRAHASMPADTPHPVHQMRVATRRLRSALLVFRPHTTTPDQGTPDQGAPDLNPSDLNALNEALRICAAALGAARDWDVFLDGIGARLAADVPGDKRVAALLRAATRRRHTQYAALHAYLDGPAFRTLSVALAAFAALRPWAVRPPTQVSATPPNQVSAPPTPAPTPIEAFAAAALTKRARSVRKAARGLEHLPLPALHSLRKKCKKLRYAADFFAPLFPARPTRRYTKRLAALQEALGTLNDGASVPGLMAQLTRVDGGLAEGYAAARSAPAHDSIARAWQRFRKAERFWPK